MILRDRSRLEELNDMMLRVGGYLYDVAIGFVEDCDVERDDFALKRLNRLVKYDAWLKDIRQRYLASQN